MARSSSAVLLLMLGACGPLDQGGPGEPVNEPRTGTLTLAVPPKREVLPGSRWRLQGSGFLPPQRALMRLSLSGTSQSSGESRAVQVDLPVRYESPTELAVDFDEALLRAIYPADIPADGQVEVVGTLRLILEQDRRSFERKAPAALTLLQKLRPQLGAIERSAAYLMDRVPVSGSGFLMEGEGRTLMVLEGNYARQILKERTGVGEGAQFSPYPRREQPLLVVSRTRAYLEVGARLLGIVPGALSGTVTLINRHADGKEEKTEAAPIQLSLLRTQLSGVSTTTVSRGQRIIGTGAGFLPLDPGGDTATLIRLSGTFTLEVEGGMGPVLPIELNLVGEILDSSRVLFVPRPVVGQDRRLSGLGSRAGLFVGSVRPVVILGAEQQLGVPLPCGDVCQIQVVPPKQVLFVKFLGNFTEGLRRFGLRNLEPEVRQVALQVARRTYAAWNVEIRESPPVDYDEYSTIEVGGPDPNGAGLFGLDNTEGVDVGNLRLADYIGGFNAQSDYRGSYAFGGVFIESFLAFSPRLKSKNMLATERFDEIFGPFAPELGGQPAHRSELFAGPRREALGEAVRVLGTLVGNTVAHEFGHSLGMAIDGDGVHNTADNDRELMDAGPRRSFAERAEIDEYRERPSGFSDVHKRYLDQILPR